MVICKKVVPKDGVRRVGLIFPNVHFLLLSARYLETFMTSFMYKVDQLILRGKCVYFLAGCLQEQSYIGGIVFQWHNF